MPKKASRGSPIQVEIRRTRPTDIAVILAMERASAGDRSPQREKNRDDTQGIDNGRNSDESFDKQCMFHVVETINLGLNEAGVDQENTGQECKENKKNECCPTTGASGLALFPPG